MPSQNRTGIAAEEQSPLSFGRFPCLHFMKWNIYRSSCMVWYCKQGFGAGSFHQCMRSSGSSDADINSTLLASNKEYSGLSNWNLELSFLMDRVGLSKNLLEWLHHRMLQEVISKVLKMECHLQLTPQHPCRHRYEEIEWERATVPQQQERLGKKCWLFLMENVPMIFQRFVIFLRISAVAVSCYSNPFKASLHPSFWSLLVLKGYCQVLDLTWQC